MSSMKRGIMIASTLLLVAITTSACNQAYSQPPAVTNTPIDQNSLFATALGEPTLSDVKNFATQTALASITPGPATATLAGVTPQGNEMSTPTPIIASNPTNTPTATLAVSNSGPTATLIPAGSKPATYTLQSGEFPYCIARRFNVNPDELIALNGIVDSQTLYAGKMLTIPQTGNPFPGNRMWHNHPDTYTVDSSSETVYGVACYYGDIDPSLIAQANGISVNASLFAGQQLKIP